MQTLANMSGSKDVHRQIDVNQTSIARITTYYNRFKSTLQYQLLKIVSIHINLMSASLAKMTPSARSTMENRINNAPKKVVNAMDK